jgi:hypothetical protein
MALVVAAAEPGLGATLTIARLRRSCYFAVSRPPTGMQLGLTLSATEVVGIHASTVILFAWVGIPLLRFHPHPSHRRSIGRPLAGQRTRRSGQPYSRRQPRPYVPPIRGLGIGNHAGRAVNVVNNIVDMSDWCRFPRLRILMPYSSAAHLSLSATCLWLQ